MKENKKLDEVIIQVHKVGVMEGEFNILEQCCTSCYQKIKK